MAQRQFSNSFHLYAGSIRNRTQMAFKQAAQEAAAAQKSDQERRKILKDLLELDNKQLIALRKNMAQAKKDINKYKLPKGESYKLLSLYTQSLQAAASVNVSNTDIVDEIQKQANEKYDLDPKIISKIEEYVDGLQIRRGSSDTYENQNNLEATLGTKGSANRADKFNKLKNEFNSLSQPTQKPLALYYLQTQVANKFEGMDSSVDISLLNDSFGKNLGINKDTTTNEYKVTSPTNAQRKKEALIEKLKQDRNLTKSDQNALAAFANAGRIKAKLDEATGGSISPESLTAIRGLKDAITGWESEANVLKTRIAKTRKSILSPSAGREPLNIRAGQILLEQDAMANMGRAIKNMPEEDIEAIQLMKEAQTFKDYDANTKKFIDAYVKGKNQQKLKTNNNISDFIKHVNKQTSLNADAKRKIKVAALSRILNAQKTNVKEQAITEISKPPQIKSDRFVTFETEKFKYPATVEAAFKDEEAGNKFRKYVNTFHPTYAQKIELSEKGKPHNSYMKKAYEKYGREYFQSLSK